MPCSDPNHNKDDINTHYWPPEGSLKIWPCERECGFCGFRARDSSQLRSHVREAHVGKDYPKLTVLVGQRRPPVFDSAIHGTAHLRAQYEGGSATKHDQTAAGPGSSSANYEESNDGTGQEQSGPAFQPQSVQSNEASDDILNSGGPTASVKARPRNIQLTEKAAADAADSLARKRKRAAPVKFHPHESFPSRSPKTAIARSSALSHAKSPDMNGTEPAYGQVSTTRDNTATNGHEDPTERLYTNITHNITGLLEFADACKLDKIRVYDAANDALKKWLLSQSNPRDK